MIQDIAQEASNRLAQAMARKTDDVYSEAITRFLGSKAWTIESLQGRCVLQRNHIGVETLIVDGVAIVEMLPIELLPNSRQGPTEFLPKGKMEKLK